MLNYRQILVLLLIGNCAANRPNIIFIIADDLGWNDVGFHGSSEIPTPNIDALAYSGLILNNYYVTPICTPSRSALMTGKYPIHTGMQHRVLYGAEPRGLPLTEKLLPQFLKELGYVNRIVGKWHLGNYKKEYTPTYRGFDSHLGFWTGHQDYYDHTATETPGWGLDMRNNMDVAYNLHGQYSTDIFTNEATKLIHNHNTTNPLFLYLAHAAVHSGNTYDPLRAPDNIIAKFSYIKNYNRQKFAGMLTKLDESVGKVVEALKNREMLENSIIIFTTDNGGPAAGFNLNAASNYPLKGVKNTLWEGGVRGSALIWSPLLEKSSRVAKQFMHITDWLPTLISAIGGDLKVLGEINGIDLWTALSHDLQSKRTEILHNIDDILGISALTVSPWKIIKGSSYNGQWDNWYGPSGRNYTYNITSVERSLAGTALKSISRAATPLQIKNLRSDAEVKCTSQNTGNKCNSQQSPCLFNIEKDPCETDNLADKNPEIVDNLTRILDMYNETALPPGNLPLDIRGDPKFWQYTWTNFGDYIDLNNYVTVN